MKDPDFSLDVDTLKTFIQRSGYRMAEVDRKAGLPIGTTSRYVRSGDSSASRLRGRRVVTSLDKVDIGTVARLAYALGLPTDALINRPDAWWHYVSYDWPAEKQVQTTHYCSFPHLIILKQMLNYLPPPELIVSAGVPHLQRRAASEDEVSTLRSDVRDTHAAALDWREHFDIHDVIVMPESLLLHGASTEPDLVAALRDRLAQHWRTTRLAIVPTHRWSDFERFLKRLLELPERWWLVRFYGFLLIEIAQYDVYLCCFRKEANERIRAQIEQEGVIGE